MYYIDYFFCGLMAFCGLGHFIGTFKYTERGSALFAWSLSGSLAAFLIAAVNVMRIRLSTDFFVSTVALTSSVLWIPIVFLFGLSIKNPRDPRVVLHLVAAVGLVLFSALNLVTS